MTTKQLYYLPGEDRVITRGGLAAEIEYIGREYAAHVDVIIDDMVADGLAVEIRPGDHRATFAEPESRTVLIAELFAAMSADLGVMAEQEEGEAGLLDELRTADEDILKVYQETFL